MAKKYQLLEADHIEKIMNTINELAEDGWILVTTIQEHGYTKVILEKEI